MAHEPAYALDPQLRAAQQEAQREYHQRQQQQQTTTTTTRNEHEEAEAERRPPVPPLVLKQLLSDEHIADLLRHVTAAGVWPRGLAAPPPGRGRAAAAAAAPAPAPPCAAGAALAAVPHHFAWTAEHVVLYLHNQDYWFVRTLQDAWCVVRGALEIRPWMPVGCRPELDAAFVGSDHALQRVRSIELHHYATGGNLVTPGRSMLQNICILGFCVCCGVVSSRLLLWVFTDPSFFFLPPFFLTFFLTIFTDMPENSSIFVFSFSSCPTVFTTY